MTQKRIFSCLPLAFLLLCGALSAQKRSLEDVLEVRLQNVGPIYQGEQIKGYFMLYFLDRSVDLYKSNFKLVVLDEDLNVVGEKKLLEQNDAEILEMDFNGSSIMFELYSPRWREVEVRHYDLTLKELDKYLYGISALAGFSGKSGNIVPVDQKGFVYYYADQKYGMEFFPLKGIKGWKFKNKDYDVVESRYLAQNKDILLNAITKKIGRRGQPKVCFLQGVNLSTGKIAFEKEIPITDLELHPIHASTDGAGNFLVSGSTCRFNDEGYFGLDKNTGVFTVKIDAAGAIQATNNISLSKASTEGFKMGTDAKVNGGSALNVRRAVHTSDGSVWFIGDIYAYSDDGSALKSAIFHITPDQQSASTHIIDTGKEESIEYPFRYIELNDDATAFSYLMKTNQTKGKEKTSRIAAETVYSADNRFMSDKITINPKADFSRVLPGKFGHILLIEYFKKDKKLDMRVEKFNQ